MNKEYNIIKNRVIEIAVKKLGVETKDIEQTSALAKDLGADSLDTVELCMEYEKEYGLSILDEEWERVSTVHDAQKLCYVKKHVCGPKCPGKEPYCNAMICDYAADVRSRLR